MLLSLQFLRLIFTCTLREKTLTTGEKKDRKRITDLETSINYNEDDVAELQKNFYDHRAQLDKCKKDLLYLEAYSRRENVKIFGVPQATGNENASESEDTKEIVHNSTSSNKN